MNCKNCGAPTESDGHGDLIHTNEDDTPGKYGCDPKTKSKSHYPVAA